MKNNILIFRTDDYIFVRAKSTQAARDLISYFKIAFKSKFETLEITQEKPDVFVAKII